VFIYSYTLHAGSVELGVGVGVLVGVFVGVVVLVGVFVGVGISQYSSIVSKPPMSTDNSVSLFKGIADTPTACGGCRLTPKVEFNPIFAPGNGANPNAS
jgi:hypothetical protein